MEKLDLIIAKGENNTWTPQSLHLWRVGQDLPAPFYESRVLRFPGVKSGLYERASVALRTADGIFLGMNTGTVRKFDANGELISEHSRFLDVTRFQDSDYDHEIHCIFSGARAITGLAEHKGVVYDSSAMGVFTGKNERINPLWAMSLTAYDGKLCMVPCGRKLGRSFREDVEPWLWKHHAASLVDAMTNQVLIERLTPFDGSGCSPGKYWLTPDRAYMHHGDYPAERITVRLLPDGQGIGEQYILTSHGFTQHGDKVYDIRELPDPRELPEEKRFDCYTFLTPSDESAPLVVAYKPERIISAASGGEHGILLAVYDSEKDRTRVVSHLEPDKNLLDGEGVLSFIRPRMR